MSSANPFPIMKLILSADIPALSWIKTLSDSIKSVKDSTYSKVILWEEWVCGIVTLKHVCVSHFPIDEKKEEKKEKKKDKKLILK